MPGISGLITKSKWGNEQATLERMLTCLLHEPYYTYGTYFSHQNGFYVGFSAMPKSYADCMPIYNETKDLVLFLVGECHLDSQVTDYLTTRGHSCYNKNASCLIHLYEEQGDNFYKNLNGWFSGIILDLRRSCATLFNDRCGIRRIYCYEGSDFFAFSSEAKSLLRVFPELREISPRSVGEFLTYDCVLENRTYFPKINLLPASSCWSLQEGKATKRSYLDLSDYENQEPLELLQFSEQLGSTFERILPRYFLGGRVGLGLTGGLDTRLILASQNPAPGTLPCYTFGGTYRDIFDIRIAPKVAAACGQVHTVLKLDDKQLLKDYPSLVERATYISDGLEGTDKVDVICFNKMARNIAPIRMTGKYGSQVLKGIFGFDTRPPLMEIVHRDFQKYIETARHTTKDLYRKHRLTFLLQCAIPWWWNSFVTLESSQVEVRSPFLDNNLIELLYRAPQLPSDFGIRFELDLIAKKKPALMAIPTTGTYGGNQAWPIPKLVRSYIKALMMVDKIYIRERLPFKMTHFVGKLDKWLISPLHMDRLIMGYADFRRYRTWFRDELSGYIQDILLSEKTLGRPYWDHRQLVRIVNDHIKGRGTYLREIRKVLQVELSHRVLLEQPWS